MKSKTITNKMVQNIFFYRSIKYTCHVDKTDENVDDILRKANHVQV